MLSGVRESFTNELVCTRRAVQGGGNELRYLFHPAMPMPKIVEAAPGSTFQGGSGPFRGKVGISSLSDVFSRDDLQAIESRIDEMHKRALAGRFLPLTAQHTFSAGTITRTKYFFTARYVWKKDQRLYVVSSGTSSSSSSSTSSSDISEGIRVDVSGSMGWMREIEKRLVKVGALPCLGWANQVSLPLLAPLFTWPLAHPPPPPPPLSIPPWRLLATSTTRATLGCQ